MTRSIRSWAVGLGVALALLLTMLGWRWKSDHEQLTLLPSPAAEAELPVVLRERVHAAREAVLRSRKDPAPVRTLARLYHANHRYAEAQQCYEMLAAIAPGLTVQDRYYLADIALHLGDLAQAQLALQFVAEQEPGYVPARVRLGLALLKSGETERAASELAVVLSHEPLHLEATMNLARLDLQQGDETAAVNRLEQLIGARPEATSAVALLAQLLERRGDAPRAAALREQSQQRPEPIPRDPWMEELDTHIWDVKLLGLRFEELTHAGERERAARFLRQIEAIEPGTPLVPLLQGAAAARASRHHEAASHYRAALARGGDPEEICPALVGALLATGETESALALMAEHHAKQPTSVPLLVAYSEVFVKQKDRPRAREVLSRALEYQPYLVPQNLALAEILWAQGEYQSAAIYLQRVAQIDAKHLASRALLAEYDLRRSDPASALIWLEQAQALAPTDPEVRDQLTSLSFAAHLLVAQRAMAEGAGPKALHHFDRAAEISPDEPQAHAGRAQVLVQMGDHARAADALQKLAELQPENPTVLLSLGDLRQRQGRADLAIRHWTAARDRVAPGDEPLRAALEQRLGGNASTDISK